MMNRPARAKIPSDAHIARRILCGAAAALLALTLAGAGAPTYAELPPAFVASSNNPVLAPEPGAWDGASVLFPDVVTSGDVTYVFYMGFESTPNITDIGFAILDQDQMLTRAACNPVIESAFGPLVTEMDGAWVMFYGVNAILRATAETPCGPWTNDALPVLESGSPGEWDAARFGVFSVVATDAGWHLYYGGVQETASGVGYMIGLATSPDGLSWTKYDDPTTTSPPFAESDPVFTSGPAGAWDSGYVAQPYVRRVNGEWEMVYDGGENFNALAPDDGFGYATSPDGINWMRDVRNPIFTEQDDPVGQLVSRPNLVEFGPAQIIFYDYGFFGEGIGLAVSDTDEDGVDDLSDNCLLVENADQRDSNSDGFGNICDPDLNNDGIINVVDLGLLKLVYFTADPDADFNGDGVVNTIDLGVMKARFFEAPGPSGTN